MKRKLRGSSLPTVMVLCVLISLLVLFAIVLFDWNNLFYSNYHAMKQSKEDLNSAFVLYCNDSTLHHVAGEDEGYSLYNDENPVTVHFQMHPWGLYEAVTAYTPNQKSYSTRLLGKVQECAYEAALWVCSRDMVLSFAGDTEISGKAFIPTNGISYIQLGNTPFQGKEIENSYIDLSKKELPPIDSSYIKSMNALREWTDRSPFPDREAVKPYYSFREPTVHFDLPDGSTEQLSARGNVVLYADEIALSATSKLSDVILIARKVTIGEGFSGSLQIIASDTVIIEKHVQMHYPSGVYLEGNNRKTYLSIGSHSRLNGYAVVFGNTEKSSGILIDDNYHQDSTAVFRGLLYVDGIADIRGELAGAVYIKECYYLPENGVYASTINDARISRSNRIAFPLLLERSAYRRKEIKTVY